MSICSPLALITLALSSVAVAQDKPIEGKLDAALVAADANVPIFVRMSDQLFPTGATFVQFVAEHATTPRSSLREPTITDLRARADVSFAAVHDLVDKLIAANEVRDIQRFWIINGFACTASSSAVRQLAALDAIAYVHLQTQPGTKQHRKITRSPLWLADRKAELDALLFDLPLVSEEPFEPKGLVIPWNLSRIRADLAWQSGAHGDGVVIALLDSGVLAIPALTAALWRNPSEIENGKDDDGNGYVDDLFGWDFQGDTRFVIGDGPTSHGTMCAGIMVGRPAGDPLTVTGVAPRARLMVLRGMGALRAYEYAAIEGADVLSMSYMWVDEELGSYRAVFRTAHEHLAACGVVAVGGAGNFGKTSPVGRQIALPKDIPIVITAAGVFEDDEVPAFSSRGPCRWDDVPFFQDFDAEHPLMKPDVTACIGGFPVWHWVKGPRDRKVEVVFDNKDGTGLIVGPSGNSFAGPHAAGVAALMLSVNPELTPWRIKALMEATCTDRGEPGRDVVYGAGMLRADAAVEAARKAEMN